MRIIGLGYNCAVANYLMRTNKRTRFGVNLFDNMFTYDPSDLATLLLTNGGQLFKDYEKLTVSWNEGNWSIKCKTYDIISVHDFTEKIDEETMISRLRDQKRIGLEELQQQIREASKLVILRSNKRHTKPEATVHLYDAIKTLRGNKPFKMFVFQLDSHDILNSLPDLSY